MILRNIPASIAVVIPRHLSGLFLKPFRAWDYPNETVFGRPNTMLAGALRFHSLFRKVQTEKTTSQRGHPLRVHRRTQPKPAYTTSNPAITIPASAVSSTPTSLPPPAKAYWAITCLPIALIIQLIMLTLLDVLPIA